MAGADRRWRRPVGPLHALVVAALALGVAGWRLLAPDPVSTAVEARLLDLRFQLRGPRAPPSEVVIVALDEATLAAAPGLAARRLLLAEAFGRIASAGPAAVAVDLLLVEESPGDGRLAAALAATPRLVLGVAGLDAGAAPRRPSPEQQMALERSLLPAVRTGPGAALPRVAEVLLPQPRFAAAARLGHVNILRAPDRVARELPLAIGLGGGRWLPALPLAAVALATGGGPAGSPAALVLDTGRGVTIGGRLVPTDRAGRIVLDHSGGAGTVPTLGLGQVAAGAIAPGRLAGRIVFVGSTAASLRDTFATPLGADVAGVEVLATAAVNLLRGRTIRRGPAAAAGTAALALAAALAALAAGAVRRRWLAAAATLAVAGLAGAALQAGFAPGGLWLDATAVIAALGLGAVAGGIGRFRAERALTDTLSDERRNLARYVSPVLADVLARSAVPGFDRRRQDAAVLFVDVAGYTASVEDTDPVEVAGFLRRLHGVFEDCAERHGGVVVDFLGDGAMIVFGLPAPAADDAARALACADALAGPAGGLGPAGAPVALRVSLHFGPIATAILGGRRQGQVSITGDTVNVASRLQEYAKAAGAAMVTTRETLLAAGLDPRRPPGFEFLGADPMRGRRHRIEVYRRAARPQVPAAGGGAGIGGAHGG